MLLVSAMGYSWAQTCDDGLACYFDESGSNGLISLDIGDDVPILTGFEISYIGGDQHIKDFGLGVLPEDPGKFQFILNDNDSDESIRGWARFFTYKQTLRQLREFYSVSETAAILNLRSISRNNCEGNCQVEIPGFDKTRYRLFLSGFKFSFTDGDKHLKQFRIWPTGDVAGTSGVWTAFHDNDRSQKYDVTLSYVLLPIDHPINGLLYGGTVSETDSDGTVLFPRPNLSGRALSGFGASYADNDEHLLKVGVKVDRSGGAVTLRDNDAAESITPFIASWRLPVE